MQTFKKVFSKTNIILYSVILGIVFIDLLSKILVNSYMDIYESINIIPYLINFTYIANKGGAWGMLSEYNATLWLAIFSLIFVIIFLYLNAYQIKNKNLLYNFSFVLIVGGTFGNMIDRFSLGYVRDFIEFDFINFPVFNIADICLVVGVFLFCLWYILTLVKSENKEVLVLSKDIKEKQNIKKSTVENIEEKEDLESNNFEILEKHKEEENNNESLNKDEIKDDKKD